MMFMHSVTIASLAAAVVNSIGTVTILTIGAPDWTPRKFLAISVTVNLVVWATAFSLVWFS